MVKSGSGFAKTWRSKSYSGPEHAELGAVRTQAAQLLKKLPLLTLIEFLLLPALASGNKGGGDVVVIVVVAVVVVVCC